jgi:hypothetical protein
MKRLTNNYSLTEAGTEMTLFSCCNVFGLFGDNQIVENGRRLHVIEFKEVIELKNSLGFLKAGLFDLSILDFYGNVIGKYELFLERVASFNEVGELIDITAIGEVASQVCSKKEIELWKYIVNDNIYSADFFNNFSLSEKRSFVNISRLVYCNSFGRQDIRDGDISLELNGSNIKDIPSFFLNFSYSLYGRFGYVGNCLNGMIDILRTDLPNRGRVFLVWLDSSYSKKYLTGYSSIVEGVELLRSSVYNMDYEEMISDIIEDPGCFFSGNSFFDEVLETFSSIGVEVDLK